MSSWNQNQTQQPMMNIAQPNMWGGYGQRLPIYRADPIHGQNAAWQFPMGPNSEIYLPDADQDIMWWIRTDANGARTVTPFDVMVHKEPEPVDMNNILERLNSLEEKVNAKYNKSNAKRSTIEPAANPATVE